MQIDEKTRVLLSRAKIIIENNAITSREEGAGFNDAMQWLSDLKKLKREYHNVDQMHDT